jgi:acyl-homoserine-lactone acylase
MFAGSDRSALAGACAAILGAMGLCALAGCSAQPYHERVEIRRTAYGVPHILAEDLGAMAFGLAYAHMEDHGQDLVQHLLRVRGELARESGPDSIESDFWWRQRHRQAVRAYEGLHRDARDLYEGYAAGVNQYIEMHSEEFPDWVRPIHTGPDIAAHWVDENYQSSVDAFRRSRARRDSGDTPAADGIGSNAWAFGPSRTVSGHAILLRNPHLRWGSGYYGAYYEAHVTVPGVLDFYGDFRVGYPLYFNGGFNRHLGWATTNNSPDVVEIYSLEVDSGRPDHYLFDGRSLPVDVERITVEFLDGSEMRAESREYRHTVLGPVIDQAAHRLYVARSPAWGEFRRTEQALRMMQAASLDEWKAAVGMRAHTYENLVYADRDGNIFYVWNAALPLLPHKPTADTVAVEAGGWADVWTELVPFDSLPQLLNPAGGYLHSENDPFHYTNLNEPLPTPLINSTWPDPRLRLRSQLALQLIHDDTKHSLEDVILLKHSPRMLLADRVKDDLVAAVRASGPSTDVAQAIDLIESWDNTTASESRGGLLFQAWWDLYLEGAGDPYAEPWSQERPTATPAGLADPDRAATTFARAVADTRERHGSWDVAWGEVHRVRWGDVDAPVSGCPSNLGCFRHLDFRDLANGRRVAYTGDAWILAVEFGDIPRAYSVLVFGQSSKPDSPHLSDQAEMFARGKLKPVAFTEDEIEAQLTRRYRPGVEAARP